MSDPRPANLGVYLAASRPAGGRGDGTTEKDTVIDQVIQASLEGLAKALGERLIKAPGERVAINKLTAEINHLRSAHEKTEVRIGELTKSFEEVVRRADGLILARSEIHFQATEASPTLGDALLNLDEQISELRPEAATSTASVPSKAQGKPGGTSIFDGIDQEIMNRRHFDNEGHRQC